MAGHGNDSGSALRSPPSCCDDGVVSSGEVARILADISNGQTEAIRTLRDLAKQSDGNRQCVASSNADVVLASAFCANCTLGGHPPQAAIHIDVCEDAIGALALIFPISEESRESLASFDALRRIAWILRRGSPDGRRDAVLILQELMFVSDGKYRERIGAIDGLAEGLVEVVKEGACPAATKASLAVIYHIAGGRRIRVKMVEAGAVPVLLELLPEADRGTCERAMASLDLLCDSSEGRSAAETHALAIPLLVKKLLRVSQLTSEFAVCVLWTICHNSSNESLLVDAVEVGAFDKLMVFLQTACTFNARGRAAQLLKLLNNYRPDRDCPHAMDSKHTTKR